MIFGPFRSRQKQTQLDVYVSNKRFKIELFTANFESSAEYLRQVHREEPEYIPDKTSEDGQFDDPPW